MGAPVALASDPLKRSSFLQVLYLCIKHLLRYDSVRLYKLLINLLRTNQSAYPCLQVSAVAVGRPAPILGASRD